MQKSSVMKRALASTIRRQLSCAHHLLLTEHFVTIQYHDIRDPHHRCLNTVREKGIPLEANKTRKSKSTVETRHNQLKASLAKNKER
ncbi:hypothetical protein BDV25DRAFT_166170, partial [Aspergillus avenaceus]